MCITPFTRRARVFPLPNIDLIGDAWAEQEKQEPSLAESLMAKLPSWLGGAAGEASVCTSARYGGGGRCAQH